MTTTTTTKTTIDGSLMQALAVLAGLLAIWLAQRLSKKLLAPWRWRRRSKSLAGRHFVRGAQLLSRSRSMALSASSSSSSSSASSSSSKARAMAREAGKEADKAISLNPLDSAAFVLKSLALEQQGLLHDALRSMDTALSPELAPSLSSSEMADALLKRAGLCLSISSSSSSSGARKRKVLETAIADLESSLRLSPKNPKILCMLGMAQEKSRLFADAEKSYVQALALDPELDDARAGLLRLRP